MNNGKVDSDKSFNGDERYTPFYAVRPLVKYIPKDKIVWCPFDDDWSAFPKVLKENGIRVINSSITKGQNFFDYEPDHWDILVSNPPYSKNGRVLEKIMSFNKPYALLLPFDILQAQAYFYFISNNLQLLLFDSRIKYFSYPDFSAPQAGVSFGSAYFCKDLLPRDIVAERIQESKEPLMTQEEAKSFNITIVGDYTLDMFGEEDL